jgi:hypothetical protein
MVCSVCGSLDFLVIEYRAETGEAGCRAPARQCCDCGAIQLRGNSENTQEELGSIGLAMAMRAAIFNDEPIRSTRRPPATTGSRKH